MSYLPIPDLEKNSRRSFGRILALSTVQALGFDFPQNQKLKSSQPSPFLDVYGHFA
jgi:hypothetical protein